MEGWEILTILMVIAAGLIVAGLMFSTYTKVHTPQLDHTPFKFDQSASTSKLSTITSVPIQSWQDIPQPPAAQHLISYSHGGEKLQLTSSILLEGVYVGEFGMDFAETIGKGSIKKAAALEVWLFDKGYLHAECLEIASEYAFRDAYIHDKLAQKGRVLLAKAGEAVQLDTPHLVLRAHILSCIYHQDRIYPETYFESMTLQVGIWKK